MGNGNQPFLRRPTVQGIGMSAALGALAVINVLFAGGQIDCGDPSKDHIEVLTTTAEYEKNGVQVVVCIVDGKGLYDIELIEYDEKDPKSNELADTGFEVTTYFANFKVRDKTGEIVTKFPKGIEISILYTEEALERIYAQGYITPRAAFQAFENGNSNGDWEELGGTVIKEFGSDDLSILGYEQVLVIKYWTLPDPRIGGC